MKKMLAALLAGLVCLSLAACGENSAKKPTASSSKSASSEAGSAAASHDATEPLDEESTAASSEAHILRSAITRAIEAKQAEDNTLYVKFGSIAEYLENEDVKAYFEELKASNEELGMYLEVKANGNRLTYIYTLDMANSYDVDCASLEAGLDANADKYRQMAKSLHEIIIIKGKASIEIIFKTYNGNMICSRVFEEP